ncbi:D-2-hydroxyacid dehydrogenase [Lachnospiraceae bacterium OttesenSCG-928-E19]|nr:D-2-hydroxyacid dehydrogenase [Lachnospiraceae bacterium OttesenSCG-928-E19]
MEKILVTLPVNEKQRRRLEKDKAEFDFEYVKRSDVTPEQIAEADYIIGNVEASYIKGSPKLKLLQLNSAGTDGYTKEGVLAPNTILANATGAYGKAVSEHMFAMLLALQKKLMLYRDDQYKGEWNDYGSVTSITDSTVLVVGLGDIGKSFAKMCKALGAYVIGVKRRPSECPEEVDELVLMDEFKDKVPKADVVFSVLPNTPATSGIYNEEFFKLMKPTGIFLNAGRGNAVNQEALLEALQKGDIGAAGLDVTNPEPLPAEHPLWAESKVLITPHISGQYHLPETLDRIVEIGASNVERYIKGEDLLNIVDFETGYCK